MIFSKHNIFSQIRDTEHHLLVNVLTGSADILDAAESALLRDFLNGKELPSAFRDALIHKGYLLDESEEKKLYRTKYLDFIDRRDDDEIQLFVVPNYSCNFACTYCYQDEYLPAQGEMTFEITDAFFRYISTEFAGRKKYLTIFGGEPLLASVKQKDQIAYLLKRAHEAALDVCIVTNGYHLEEYVPMLKNARIREVQVTLDGKESVHDRRRFLKGGGASFDKIVKGIDACLQQQLPVNLRVVIDRENIHGLPELAQFAIDRGWTSNPMFKTQLGRNYELHHCQSGFEKLFSRLSLYEAVFRLMQEHPHIEQFHKPAFSISKFIAENGSLPDPLFDACPGCKTEWAFDFSGHIYSCTATVGKLEESLGTFFPVVNLNKTMVKLWENRDVTTIPECGNCEVQLACGGGCASVAKNRTGTVCASDCRPVKGLLELGFARYFTNETTESHSS